MKLVYDVNSLPEKLGISNMVKIMENHRTVFWDSSKDGIKPKFYSGVEPGDEESPITLVDTAGKEIDLEYYERVYKEDEFWEKELYSCKNSPVYFFNNYGTTEYPAKSEGIQKYLKDIGLSSIVAKDSEDAAEAWKTQKDAAKKAGEHITLELLKERKQVMDIMKEEYNVLVIKLETKVKDSVRLFDSNNIPLEAKKQCGNLIDKIRKILPVNVKYSDNYRTKKGKWDTPMLFNTSYSVLLKMYDDIYEDSSK
jgi:hypothetical protein